MDHLLMQRARFLSIAIFLWTLSTGPALASPPTFVQVVSGSGELAQWTSGTSVDQAVPLTFRWWTNAPGTTGGRWDVERAGSPTAIATGTLTGSPNELHPYTFTLPAQTFLAPKATATPVTYTLHVTALNGGAPSQTSDPVTIIEVLAGQANLSGIPLDTNAASKLPPVAPPEAGHPIAKLIAYRPITAFGVGAFQEGMLTLEFSSPSSSATDPVTVSVSDLNQVVRQTDLNVVVPSLPKGGYRFRVAIALGVYQIVGDDPGGSAWMKRYAKGVSVLIGTAKLQSPYVQYQQPPILTGATNSCVGQGCAPATPPWLAVFRPSGLPSNNDESIAAGQDFLYLEDYNSFAVYDKYARQYGPVDLTNTDLASGTPASQLAWKGGGDATLFQMFWYPDSHFDVNPAAVPKGPIPCTAASPSDLVGGNAVFDKNNPGLSTTSCINQFYDARLTYDAGRQRFWLVSHAANDISNSPKFPCSPVDMCQKAFAQIAHQVFVAVSKSEAPSAGFLKYDLDDANVDWPMMAVQGRYLLISYHGPATPLRLYDADALAQGVKTELTPGFSPADFANGMVRMPKHHNIKHDIAFIVSTNGASLNLYAWNAATGRPTLLGPGGYTNSSGAAFDTAYDGYQAVVRGNDLYVTTSDGTRVLVWRIPFTLKVNGIDIVASQVSKWAIQQSNLNFDYPTIDVTRNGDVVVAFRAWNTNVPDQLWIDVLYHGEDQFRHSMVVSAPTTQNGGQPGGRFDFDSSSIDPSDDETVWISTVDGTGPIVTSVRP